MSAKSGRIVVKKKARRKSKHVLDRMIVENFKNAEKWKWGVMIGIPSLGQVRMEWATAFSSVIIPMNFSTSRVVVPVSIINPLSYHVAEAQNIIVRSLLTSEHEWEFLLLIEDDVIITPDIFLRLAKWIKHGVYPVVSGLYRLKSDPAEPMTFRGRGNGSYVGWMKGPGSIERRADLPDTIHPKEVAFCDGVPAGCLLISKKLLQVAWSESRDIKLTREMSDGSTYQLACREVFKTVREAGQDPETGVYFTRMGTSDLEFCDAVVRNGWLKKAGYHQAAKMKYPFPVDLKLDCGHIALATGKVY